MLEHLTTARFAKFAGAIAVLSTVGACSTYKAAEKDVVVNTVQVDEYLAAQESIPAHKGPMNVRYTEGVWLGSVGVRSDHGQPLPSRFEGKTGVTISSARPMTLADIAGRITAITGIPVNGLQFLRDANASPAIDDKGVDPSGAFAPPPASMSGGSAFPEDDIRFAAIELDWTGPLSGLLDYVGSRFAISWEYRNGAIRVYDVETRSFTLIAPPSTSEITTSINSSLQGSESTSSNDGSTSSANQGVINTVSMRYWERVEETIEAIVPKDTPFAVSPEAGTITVTASPSILKRVSEYVKQENARLARQVAITVKVLSVSLSDTDDYNLSLTGLFDGNDIDLSFASAATSALTGASNLSVGIVNATGKMGQFDGSEAVIKALSKKGDVSLLTTANVVTMNNQPAPVQVTTQTGYLKSLESNTGTDDSDLLTVSVEPGVVTTGFSMNLLPRILSDGRIALQYNLSLSDLTGMETVGTEGAQIQVPEVDTRGFLQSVMIRSGSTLVLAGYEQTTDSIGKTGTGTPDNWLLGGGVSAEKSREAIVILLTPVIIDDLDQISVAR